MTQERNSVAADQVVTTTPNQVDHTNNLHNVIEEFFSAVIPSECLDANTRLLNAYIGKEGEYTHEHLQEIVYVVNAQNRFLIELYENWDRYTRFVRQSYTMLTVPSTKPTVPS